MSGAIELTGDLATGAAWAGAVEPATGEYAKRSGHGECLNCGTALVGRYCHGCGQSGHVHRTLISIVHDLLHGVFHFEGKIWRTTPMLVLHPGQLTRRYIDGERAKFVSPLALYLFTVFLMFAVYSFVAPADLADGLKSGWQRAAPELQHQHEVGAATLARLEQRRATLAAAGRSTAGVDAVIAQQQQDLAALTRVTGKVNAPLGKVTVHSRVDWIDRALEGAKENPGLVVYKVQSAAYKYSWVLIFLSTPLVALTFLWRRRFGLYDHATFVTYSISFMSLLVIVLELLLSINAPKPLFYLLALLAPPIHMFAQLRGAYALSVFGALWRTLVLMVASTMVLATFVVGIIVLEITH